MSSELDRLAKVVLAVPRDFRQCPPLIDVALKWRDDVQMFRLFPSSYFNGMLTTRLGVYWLSKQSKGPIIWAVEGTQKRWK